MAVGVIGVIALTLIPICTGLDCKSCFHISSTMKNVPPLQYLSIKTILGKFQYPECLSLTMTPNHTKTCQAPVSNGGAHLTSRCLTIHILMTATGMENISSDATLQLTFHGRECAARPATFPDGCIRLKDYDQKETVLTNLKILVQNWNNTAYEGEICYHDHTAAFKEQNPNTSASSNDILPPPPVIEV